MLEPLLLDDRGEAVEMAGWKCIEESEKKQEGTKNKKKKSIFANLPCHKKHQDSCEILYVDRFKGTIVVKLASLS